jgi:hypothetical protein
MGRAGREAELRPDRGPALVVSHWELTDYFHQIGQLNDFRCQCNAKLQARQAPSIRLL